MFRTVVISLLITISTAAQIRIQSFDPAAKTWIHRGHTLSNGDILIGGQTEAGLFPLVNAFQPKHASSGLRRTRDGGRTWEDAQRPVPTPLRLIADSTDPAVLYALDANALYRTTDSAETWTRILSEQPLDVQTGTLEPTSLFVLTAGELLSSPDRGDTWTRRPLPELPNPRFSRIALDPFTRSTLYACGLSGLYRTTGAAWSPVPIVAPAFACYSIYFDPGKAGVSYVAAIPPSNGAFFRSTDGMATWTRLNGVRASTLGLDPLHSGVLYGFSPGFPAVMSTDYGDTWKDIPANPVSGSIAIIPGEPSTIVYPGALSYDGGLTWSLGTLSNVTACRAAPGAAYMLIAPQMDGFVARLAPSGEIRFSTILGGSYRDYVTSVASDDRGNLYAAGYTVSDNFPTTPGVVQRRFIPAFSNGFIAKFDPTGALIWSTMTRAHIEAIAVDRDHSVVFLS
ncbi:MAG: SBBP repeat-containing protein, partial [Bryobacterales bacterium]|nr:SBBP repeat-containing protein [Bryobacterales bacterium]